MIIVALKKHIAKIPKSPGVYKFYDAQNKLIYIGKATSLRNRVRSYFSGSQHDNKTEQLVSQIKKIKIEKTETVLEALILESNLIKKNQPKYNIKAKDDKSFSYFLITKNEEFPRVLIARKTDLGKYPAGSETRQDRRPAKKIFGPYTSKSQMETALKIIRKIFPFHSRKQKTEKNCLDFQLGKCSGPYAGAISKKDYLKNIRGIEMILQGKKKSLIKKMEKEMKELAKKYEFEKAAETRNKVFALKHIQDIALISESNCQLPTISHQLSNPLRIEAYDISNLGGDYSVGSMIVFTNNKSDKSQYRKFKIKNVEGINDIKMMEEVLSRRIKNNWPKPNIIILDGGKGHLNMAEKLLRDAKWDIPIAAVAKGPTRKKLDLYYTKNTNKHFGIISDLALMEKIRNEAHRFAIAYHRKLRQKNWINTTNNRI